MEKEGKICMKGLIEQEEIEAYNQQAFCIYDEIEFEKVDWLAAYARMCRQFSFEQVSELKFVLAHTNTVQQAFTAALRLADLIPCEFEFKEAMRLAQSTSLDELEAALYYEGDRSAYIALSIAIAHYELLKEAAKPYSYIGITIQVEDGKVRYYRKYLATM
jgi:hypothetical protein